MGQWTAYKFQQVSCDHVGIKATAHLTGEVHCWHAGHDVSKPHPPKALELRDW